MSEEHEDDQAVDRAHVGRQAGSATTAGAVAAGVAASFGLVISGAVVAVIAAGVLQWVNIPRWLDNLIPLLVLAGGLLLSGRVATDVAGRFGPWCGVGAAALVGLLGAAVSKAGEAHGDGVEPTQIVVAFLTVLALTGGSAWWVSRQRSRTR